MAWDTALAQAIKGTSRAEANRKPQPWYRAEVVQVTPKLIFAIADKEFKFDSSTGLIMTVWVCITCLPTARSTARCMS